MERFSYVLSTLLLNSAWLIAAILAIAMLCSMLLRRAPARYRHFLWVAALVLSLLLPGLSLRRIATTQAVFAGAVQNVEIPLRVSASAESGQTKSAFHLAQFAPLPIPTAIARTLAALYLAFVLYRVCRIGLAWRHTQTLRRSAAFKVHGGRLHTVVERCSAAFGLKDVPAIFLTDCVGPVTVGTFRPILLIPAAFSESASEPELVSAISHELAHIRRHDFAFNFGFELVCLPVSFHPAVTLIKSRIESTRELACDDMAADKLNSRTVYARSLLSIAASLCATVPAPGYGQGLFDTTRMEERIMNLVEKSNCIGIGWGRVSASVSIIILATASLGASTFSLHVAQPAAQSLVAAAMQDHPGSATTVERRSVAEQNSPAPDSSKTISVRNVTVIGGDEVPGAQSLLSSQLKGLSFAIRGDLSRLQELEDKTIGSDAGARARMLYQDQGYFKVITQPEVTPVDADTVDLVIHVTAGPQYRLAEVQFRGNRLFTEPELRALFAIQSGEVFRPSAVRIGLDAMRRLYASKGFSETAPTPAVVVDDSNRTVLLTITIEESQASSTPALSAAAQDSADADIAGYAKVGPGITPPKAIHVPDPQYDPASKAAGLQGTATFRVAVGTDGLVKDLRVIKSGGLPPSLIQNAENTLRQWTFEPARKDGTVVPAQVSVEINFRLY